MAVGRGDSHQRLASVIPPELARRPSLHPGRDRLDAAPTQRVPPGLEDEVVKVRLAEREHQSDAPMPEFDEMSDGALDGGFEIRIDPGVGAAGQAAAEGYERLLLLDEIIDPGVDVLRIGDDDAIDETPLGQAPQRAEQLLVRSVQKYREIQPALGELAPQAVEHRQENGIDDHAVRSGRNDDADKVGPAASQTPPRLVRGIAELRRGLPDANARQG